MDTTSISGNIGARDGVLCADHPKGFPPPMDQQCIEAFPQCPVSYRGV